MSSEHLSTRVNAARLPQYVGRTVRLTCKMLTFQNDVAVVEAADGGQVEVKLPKNATISDTYVEIIGSVVNDNTIRMMACLNLGQELDMKLVNDTIELIHDPRFYDKMFA